MERDDLSAAGLWFIAQPGMAWASWLIFGWLCYFFGVKLLGGTATLAATLRVTAFAAAPSVLNVLPLGPVPCIAGLWGMMVGVWSLAATVVGLREALSVSQGRAVLVTIMALIPFLVAFAVWFAMEMPRWLAALPANG